jgi:anti-anti-sigma factor
MHAAVAAFIHFIKNKGDAMEIQVTKEKDTVVVTVKGRIDAVTAPEFEKQLADQMAAGEKMFLLNFSGLEYISSAGLRSILVTAKQLKAKEGKLFFAELQRTVKDVFKISGFGSLFKIYDSEAEALAQV